MHYISSLAVIHLDTSNILAATLFLIGAASFTAAYFRAGMAKDTIKIQQSNNGALSEKIRLLEDSDKQKTRQIAELQGEVKTLKTVPLERIEQSLDALAHAVELLVTSTTAHNDQAAAQADRIIGHLNKTLRTSA